MKNSKTNLFTMIGPVLMAIGVVLSMTNMEASSATMAFVNAAAPWVLLGLGVAFTVVGAFAQNKEKKDR